VSDRFEEHEVTRLEGTWGVEAHRIIHIDLYAARRV
jgi:hypothetical protein